MLGGIYVGLLDIFKAKENEELKKEISELKAMVTPELKNAKQLSDYIKKLESKKNTLKNTIDELNYNISELTKEINLKKNDLVILDERILFQEFGLYEPIYDFANSDMYKEKLKKVRDLQKNMIKNKSAVNYFDGWIVNGSKSEGKIMTNNNIKQILRTFNIECESVINKVKFNNIESMTKRIMKSFESLNKINQINRVAIKSEYLYLKIEELDLAYEYQLKKQEEKEEQRHIREELREQAKLEKELEETRKSLNKEFTHYKNALDLVVNQLESKEFDEEQRKAFLEKKDELQSQVNKLNEKLADIDYRQNNQKAGYVYVISNIGSFGKDVYKIGMTRRLNPEDRVKELGDASVPFKFDIHAMIFSDDAPKLENALHKAFDNKKVNMINKRREFFKVSLDDIEKVVKANFDKTVEFNRIPEAEQYRKSIKIRESLGEL